MRTIRPICSTPRKTTCRSADRDPALSSWTCSRTSHCNWTNSRASMWFKRIILAHRRRSQLSTIYQANNNKRTKIWTKKVFQIVILSKKLNLINIEMILHRVFWVLIRYSKIKDSESIKTTAFLPSLAWIKRSKWSSWMVTVRRTCLMMMDNNAQVISQNNLMKMASTFSRRNRTFRGRLIQPRSSSAPIPIQVNTSFIIRI